MSNNGLFGTNATPPQLRQTALQPAGIPGSTYVRPQEYEAGTNLNALASALGGLNQSLQNFSARQKQKAEDPNDLANRQYVGRVQQMNLEQLRAEAASGSADGNLIKQDALASLLGERQNAAFRDRWLTFYNTEFDKTGGNMQAEYDRLRSEFASELPDDVSKGNFFRLTGPHFEQWQNEDTKAKVSYVQEQIGTTVVQSFRTANEDMAGAGKTPQERANAILTMSASNREFLEMSGQQQDATIMQFAQELALQGEEELVTALLQGTRNGSDGRPLPALGANPKYTTDALKLIESAGNIADQTARDNGYPAFVAVSELVRDGKFTEAEAEKYRGGRLFTDEQLSTFTNNSTNNRIRAEETFIKEQAARQTRLASEQAETSLTTSAFMELTGMNGTRRIADKEVPSFDGTTTRTITSKAQIDGAVTMFENAMASQEKVWVEQGMDPAEAARRTRQQKLMWYSQNSIPNAEWSDILNGIAPRATVEVLLERGDVAGQIMEQAELYRELSAANPAYLSTMLTDAKSKAFLETYAMAVENRRMPKEGALHYAATQVAQPEHIKVQSILSPQQTDNLVTGLLRDLGFDERSSNADHVRQRVIDLGMSNFKEDEIRDRLKQEIGDTTVEIHGMLVPDRRDLPKDFPELVEAELQGALEVFGATYGITDINDLYVVPVSGQSKWLIVAKSLGGLPLGGGAYVTPQSLDVQRQKKSREHDALVLQQLVASDAERATYQQQYEASIAEQRALIEVWRNKTGKLAPTIADYMQDVLDDRLERDRILREMTPEKLQEELARLGVKRTEMNLNGTGAGLGSWSPVVAPPM